MKKIFLGLLAGAVLGAAGSWLVLQALAPHEVPGAAEGEKKPAESETPGAGVHLTKEQQTQAGITVVTPEPGEVKPGVKAFGRVLDASGLATGLADIESMQAAAAASAKEFDRLKGLGDNAAARALESAEAAMKRDLVAVQSARARLLATWGRNLTERQELGSLTRSLLMQSAALIRIDVPAAETISAQPSGIQVAPIAGDQPAQDAEFIGPAPNADPQSPGRAFLALVLGPNLPPGTMLTATLAVAGPAQRGLRIPSSAVIQTGSELFVFVQTDSDHFARKRVELGPPQREGAFVVSGLNADDRVVARGAQQLLSEEMKSLSGE